MKILPETEKTCKTPIIYGHQEGAFSEAPSLTLVVIRFSLLLG
jgi:hypothetical protein